MARDTEWDASCGMEEIREFCFKEFAVVMFILELFCSLVFLIILLITSKRSMLIAAAFLLYKYHKMYS